MNKRYISVILPTFNRASTLPRAIESVLSQSFKEFELVVIDDGSTDETQELLKNYKDSRLQIVRQSNQGRSIARNNGVRASTGQYVTMLDSDDEAKPDWLEELGGLAVQTQADIVSCGLTWVFDDADSTDSLPKELGEIYHGLEMLIRSGTYAIRREHFLGLGGYREGLECCEHTELALRIADKAKQEEWALRSVHKALVLIHQPGGTLATQPDLLAETIDVLVNIHPEKFKKHPKKMAQYYGIAGVNAARIGEIVRARRYFLKAVQKNPRDIKGYLRLAASFVPGLWSLIWKKLN